MSDATDQVPCRPWTLTLEVTHLDGPPFDLDQHGAAAEGMVTRALGDMTLRLPGGTTVRVESHIDRRGLTTALEIR